VLLEQPLMGGRVIGPDEDLMQLFQLSCQDLAQNTHPYMPPKKGRKALLERLCQGM
jgi:hypothetical protein